MHASNTVTNVTNIANTKPRAAGKLLKDKSHHHNTPLTWPRTTLPGRI
jgi:hypothetical protein